MRDHRRYACSVWVASLLRADMIFGKDRDAVRLPIVCQILLDERGLPSAVRSFIDHLAIHFREDELLRDASGP
jgi:hypothetical protein